MKWFTGITLPEQSCGGSEERTEPEERNIKTDGAKWSRFRGGDRRQICGILLLGSPNTRREKSSSTLMAQSCVEAIVEAYSWEKRAGEPSCPPPPPTGI